MHKLVEFFAGLFLGLFFRRCVCGFKVLILKTFNEETSKNEYEVVCSSGCCWKDNPPLADYEWDKTFFGCMKEWNHTVKHWPKIKLFQLREFRIPTGKMNAILSEMDKVRGCNGIKSDLAKYKLWYLISDEVPEVRQLNINWFIEYSNAFVLKIKEGTPEQWNKRYQCFEILSKKFANKDWGDFQIITSGKHP